MIKANRWPHKKHVRDVICPFATCLLWCELKIKKIPLRLLTTTWVRLPQTVHTNNLLWAHLYLLVNIQGVMCMLIRFSFLLNLCWHRNAGKKHLLSLKAKHQTSLHVKERMKLLNKWERANNLKELFSGFRGVLFVCFKAEVVSYLLRLLNLRVASHEAELSGIGRSILLLF